MSKQPQPTPPIVTNELPLHCPACFALDVARVEALGIWTLRCKTCGWSERYQVVERVPDIKRPDKDSRHLAFKKRYRVGPHR